MNFHTFAEYRAEMKRRFPYVVKRADGYFYETGERVTAQRQRAILGDACQSLEVIADRALREIQR